MIKRIIFCLGSNIGNRQLYLDNATKLIEEKLNLKNIKKSSTLENEALLLEGSPKDWDVNFYNIAISADINLEQFSPLKILEIIQQIEINLGKINRGKWAPREIDIDIVAIDDLKFNFDKTLQIPHRELFNRDFFLKTIGEIEKDILEKIKFSTLLKDQTK
jgi:2-amino-4-hydroxy-6-hydroxymethyldihydropteridine diphosphokinase/dihydropteroate synthase